MKTETLIHELATQPQPVRRLRTPWVRAGLWLGLALLCVGSALAFYGDYSAIHFGGDARWWLHTILFAALTVSAGASACHAAVPGRASSKLMQWLPVGLLVGWMIILGCESCWRHGLTLGFANFGWRGLGCARTMTSLSVIPAIILLLMIRRAAPVQTGWGGMLAIVAAVGAAGLGLQLLCHAGNPMHFLVWHMSPILALGLLGIILGRAVLRW